MTIKNNFPIKAWLCHEPYSPGFVADSPIPAHDFVTMDPDVAWIYNGKALVLLEDVVKYDQTEC